VKGSHCPLTYGIIATKISTELEDSDENAHTTRCSGRYHDRIRVRSVTPRLETLLL